MRTLLNLIQSRHETIIVQTEDIVKGYLEKKIEEYRVADENERDQLDIQVYGFLEMAFGSDQSAVPYSKSLNYYSREKVL